jgi:histidinol dehydrogenase
VQLDPEVKAAFDVAYENIKCFHAAQQKNQHLQVETMPVSAFGILLLFLVSV